MKKKPTKNRRLTPKQALFVVKYFELQNAAAAYREAYHTTRMKPATVYVRACEELKKPHVQAAYEELVAQSRAECLLDKARLVEEWTTQAFTDVLNVFDNDGKLRPMEQLTREQRACIKRVKRHENGSVEVEFVDRQKALEALSKYLGLFDKADEPQRVVIDVWRTA